MRPVVLVFGSARVAVVDAVLRLARADAGDAADEAEDFEEDRLSDSGRDVSLFDVRWVRTPASRHRPATRVALWVARDEIESGGGGGDCGGDSLARCLRGARLAAQRGVQVDGVMVACGEGEELSRVLALAHTFADARDSVHVLFSLEFI